MYKIVSFIVVLILAGCASPGDNQSATPEFDSARALELLNAGAETLPKNAKRAKEEYFDLVIAECESAFPNVEGRFYYARTPAESIFYLLKAAANKKNASVLKAPCAEAHFLAGYASIDLGDLPTAELQIQKALQWSPANAHFEVELAHIRQIQRDWKAALEIFSKAEGDAKAYSPEHMKTTVLSRAKRGSGFVLIELGRLDDAEAKFQECLEIDSNDEKAKHELAYISDLRKKSAERQP